MTKELTLAKRIKEARKQLDWSQDCLHEISKVSIKTIQRIEKGGYMPRIKTIEKLSQCLGIEPAEINTLVSSSSNNKPIKNSYYFFRVLRGRHVFQSAKRMDFINMDYSYRIDSKEKFEALAEFFVLVSTLGKEFSRFKYDDNWSQKPNEEEWDRKLGEKLSQLRGLEVGIFSKLYLRKAINPVSYSSTSVSMCYELIGLPMDHMWIQPPIEQRNDYPLEYAEIGEDRLCFLEDENDKYEIIHFNEPEWQKFNDFGYVKSNLQNAESVGMYLFFKQLKEKEIKEFLHDEYFGNNRYSYIPYGRDGGLNQVPVDEYWIHDALSEGYLCLVKSFDEESNEFEEEASIDEAYEMYDNTQIEFGKNQAAQVWEAYLAKKGEKKVPFFNRYYAQYEREKDTFVKTEII